MGAEEGAMVLIFIGNYKIPIKMAGDIMIVPPLPPSFSRFLKIFCQYHFKIWELALAPVVWGDYCLFMFCFRNVYCASTRGANLNSLCVLCTVLTQRKM